MCWDLTCCLLIGDNNWPVIRDLVDQVVLVSEEEIVAAMRMIWERMKLVGTLQREGQKEEPTLMR